MKNRERFDGLYLSNLIGLNCAVGHQTKNRTRRSGESIRSSKRSMSKYKSENREIPSSLRIVSKGYGGTTQGQGAIVKELTITNDRQQILDTLTEGIFIFDQEGRIRYANLAAVHIFGLARGDLIGKRYLQSWEIYYANGQRMREDQFPVDIVMRTQRAFQGLELIFELFTRRRIVLSVNGAPFYDEQGQVMGVIFSFMDITDGHQVVKQKSELDQLKYTNTLLEMFAKTSTRKEYLHAVAQLISEISNCECVGIRVVHEGDLVPFEAMIGFTSDLCDQEKPVCLDQNDCVCSRVMNRSLEAFDPSILTEAGSLVSVETENHKPCRVCSDHGYSTLAVIAIRHHDRVIGAIHLADGKSLTDIRPKVEFLETIAPLIGEAVHRFNLEEELRRNYDVQKTINTILNLPIDKLSLKAIMQQVFDLVVAIPWLDLDEKGCLYLAEDAEVATEGGGVSNPLTLLNAECERIVFGRCAGSSSEDLGQTPVCTDVAVCLAETNYRPHHHYCVPISQGSQVLGVMNFFLKDEHSRCRGELELLNSIADTVAEIITRKRTEEQLSFSEERFAKSFYASPVPMFIATLINHKVIEVNNSFLDLTGYRQEEVLGQSMFDLSLYLNPENCAELVNLLEHGGVVDNREIWFSSKNGEARVGLLCIEPISLGNEQCLLGVLKDVTQRKQLEQEMARLDRLSLVGEMAAGIGHEVRNPMTTARGFLQMLGAKEECIQYKEYFDLVIDELDRANLIISEFLNMAKAKDINLQLQNLNDIIQALMPLMQADAFVSDKSIQVELGEVSNLLLDEKEIRQLILNLVRNGLEAMLPGGHLHISTFEALGEVVLAVRDEGQGIDPQMLEVLGTPFVTSKAEGTGLGLAVCYSIATRHKAMIKVETSQQGTTFFVRFPVEGLSTVH